MLAIKKARKLIEANPTDDASKTLAELVLALETETPFNLAEIYKLDYKRFEIALEILAEWRLDRYYAKKLRLVDVSNLAKGLAAAPVPEAT
jgi:flagellar biosynthesis/type III secretory pathway protein FliH